MVRIKSEGKIRRAEFGTLMDVPEDFEADAVWGFEAFDEGLAS